MAQRLDKVTDYSSSKERQHRFRTNVDNFRLEVDSDAISSVVVDPTGVKVRAKNLVILSQTFLQIYDCLTF